MTDSDEQRRWRRVGEDRPAYAGFVRVVHRTLRLPDGQEAIWDMIDTPGSVAVLPITPEGRVVCVRQYRPGPDRVVLSLPGGIIDPGEEVAQAAMRELREETGYAADSVEAVTSTMANNATGSRWSAVAHGCVPAHEQSLDEFEDCEPAELTVPELRRELRAGRLAAKERTYLALDHLGLL